MKLKESLFGKTSDELIQIAVENNLPGFTGKQVADWLYKKDISSIEAMTNLSKKAREILSKRYTVGLIAPTKVQESTDGTKKYLFATGDGNFIETAMIPEKDRVTVCVSSQVG
ncbi:MAG: 23S rRNA (adenine(2503)-C(2))-methyltransferase RlmN, partial [Chlorobi bacterium]|nr:23S rRNA (adenine(2503)-C(2))-methyltransferase RlmN [Chlorobiota bacterium]